MKIKNLLSKQLLFIDGNVKFVDFILDKEMEIWKLYFELDIDQKEKTSFKAKVRVGNKKRLGIDITTEIFEFDDTSEKRMIIFGNPFERNNDLVNHIIFEFYDYNERPLVFMWTSLYEIDESSREDLYPFSTGK